MHRKIAFLKIFSQNQFRRNPLMSSGCFSQPPRKEGVCTRDNVWAHLPAGERERRWEREKVTKGWGECAAGFDAIMCVFCAIAISDDVVRLHKTGDSNVSVCVHAAFELLMVEPTSLNLGRKMFSLSLPLCFKVTHSWAPLALARGCVRRSMFPHTLP